jgi:hypothetical protein
VSVNGPSLVETVGRLDSTNLPDSVRAAITELVADVSTDRIVRVIEELRACAASERLEAIAAALGNHHQGELLAALLPGARFSGEVRTRCLLTHEADWYGSFWLGVAVDRPGVRAIVASEAGAHLLHELSVDLRAKIVELEVRHPAAHAVIRDLWFWGARSLSVGHPGDDTAQLILRCPAVEEYYGRSPTPDIVDALVTTVVHTVSLDGVTDETLAQLVRLPRLEVLGIEPWYADTKAQFTARGLAHLAQCPALRTLRAARSDLGDDALAAIATIAKLEKLFVGGNKITDAGGCSLAALTALRTIDLSENSIHDATAHVLAALPAIEEVDLADTFVGAAGVRAFGSAPTLRRLGLSFMCTDEVSEASSELRAGLLEWNDYQRGGSALWGTGGYSGP